MTLRQVHRPTRISRPIRPEEPEEIAAPPQMTDSQVGGLPIQTFLPVIGALSSVVMIVVLRNNNPIFLVVGALLLVVALVGGLGVALSHRGGAARTRRTQREHYLDFLEKLRIKMRARGREVRAAASLLDPDPAGLLELIRDPARLWERRRHDADFLRVRLGVGDLRWFSLTVPEEQDPVQPYDPIMISEATAVATHYSVVHGLPVTVNLDGAGEVAIVGDRQDVLACARSLIIQLAALHAPDDVRLAAAFGAEAAAEWRGFDLLPHAIDPMLYDGPVAARRIAATAADLTKVLGQEIGDRAQFGAKARRSGQSIALDTSRLVVFLDDYGQVAGTLPIPESDLSLSDLRITTVHLLSDRLHEPSEVTVRITVRDGIAEITDARVEVDGQVPVLSATLDQTSSELFEATARTLAPLRLNLSRQDELESASSISITGLLGISEVSMITPETSWQQRSRRDFLRVPIGLDDFGAPVLLDLKESAELGMGPHGVCIGATGSGKSEMLRTLILALALSHPPEDLAMVLVDYKGGAAFAPFNGLPHVAGIIDNLADDPQLTERARASINGEIVRRQELLRDAGSVPSISHYRELRLERPELEPLPHLLVVIDEFGELLTAEPDFIDLLIQIGRIGRSIGVHLLLSSQRIEAGKLRGLDTYLSYRIGLRTFSESESSVVLDRPDAFHLPAIPGYGYLKVDTSIFRRFRSGFVSGPVIGDSAPTTEDEAGRPQPMLLPTYNGLASAESGENGEAELTGPQVGRPLVAECVDRLRSANRQVRPIWLPPLPSRLALSRVVSEDDELRGVEGSLLVSMGLLDNPSKQRQAAWQLDLGRAGGHVAVIGAPQSGRSTFLRTLAASVALTRTPRQISMYGMDLSGGGLQRIEGFPHVGGVATRAHRDKLLRLLEELHAMLAQREAVFRSHSIDSPGMLRSLHAAGRIPELVSADIVLLVDGMAQLRTDFEELEELLIQLLMRGSSFGIHCVLAMTRFNELRMSHQPLIGTRLELRLNDPNDSLIGRKLNATIRPDQPGRLLTEDSLFAQVALPVLDDTDDESLGDALEGLAARTAESWEGPAAAPIRLLPTDFPPDELPDPLVEPDLLPFGLRQDTMEPALLDLGGRDQHLLVFGDQRSGKTTLLRGIVRGLLERFSPDELVLAVMDIRGTIARRIPERYLGAQATSAPDARRLSMAIAEELEKRSHDPIAKQSGPRIVVIADDFDILASGNTEPLKPLLPYLPSARDLRLHVVLTRPVAGASRAMFDVTLQTLRDTGGTTLVLSGERSEGQIVPQVYAEQMVPGRGRFVRRGERPRIVQIANFEETEDAA
jgi:S-DNA-T family DNA segregation ATPase FtsK/SpoIIIE